MSHLIAAGAGAESFNNGQVLRAQKFLNDHNCHAIFTIGYGQSEAASNITFPCPAYPIANGNIGIPMPMNNMGIFRGEKECGYNEKGEICVTGPGNMLGYDTEEATSKTLIRHADGKLWLHTGDTGYVNEDGIFYALGRGLSKRYNPANPEKSKRLVEIAMENKISDANIPGVVDSFFVIAPDRKHNGYYVPYLYAVLEDGHTVDSIQTEVNKALKDHEHPVEIIQIPERPFYHFKTNRLHLEAPYARY
jgi:acyl-coenzyme A synthetase/AMP-(fatty) acid ligase